MGFDPKYCWHYVEEETVPLLFIYLFIYLTFLLDVKHYIIFTEAQRVKKSMLGVFEGKTLNLKNRN